MQDTYQPGFQNERVDRRTLYWAVAAQPSYAIPLSGVQQEGRQLRGNGCCLGSRSTGVRVFHGMYSATLGDLLYGSEHSPPFICGDDLGAGQVVWQLAE